MSVVPRTETADEDQLLAPCRYESDAMWKLYAGASKGVAICSTPKRMRDAFHPFRLAPNYGGEDLWAGQGHYEDLLKVRMKASMLHRFFCKSQAFAWERAFRLAISVRMAEGFGIPVPQFGIEVGADVEALIVKIMLGPELFGPERDLIVQHATRVGLKGRLAISSAGKTTLCVVALGPNHTSDRNTNGWRKVCVALTLQCFVNANVGPEKLSTDMLFALESAKDDSAFDVLF
jgi:hypothetical protein